MKYLFINVILICLIASCSNNRNENTDGDYIYGTSEEQNPDAATVKKAFQLINSISDSLTFADTAIYTKTGQLLYIYHAFSWYTINAKNNDTLKCAEILSKKINHGTSLYLKTYLLRGIAKRFGFYNLTLYVSSDAFAEMMKNDAPEGEAYNKKRKIIWNSLIGTLRNGNYYEYQLDGTYLKK